MGCDGGGSPGRSRNAPSLSVACAPVSGFQIVLVLIYLD